MINVRNFIAGIFQKKKDQPAGPPKSGKVFVFVKFIVLLAVVTAIGEFILLKISQSDVRVLKSFMVLLALCIVAGILMFLKPAWFKKISELSAIFTGRITRVISAWFITMKLIVVRWISGFQSATPAGRLKMVRIPVFVIILVSCAVLFGPLFMPPKITVSFPGFDSTGVPLDSKIEVIFNRSMIKSTVDRAFTITPKIAGDVSWEGDQKFVFTPKNNLERGKSYKLSFSGIPVSTFFIPLLGTRVVAFETIGNPTVILSSPQTEAQEDLSPVTVVFDRPMIPLTTAKNTGVKAPAFTISPAVPGEGRWLGTTAYQFRPSQRYKLATTYKVTVPAGIPSIDGGVLQKDFSWEFSSERPRITTVIPERGYFYASPVASVAAAFSQPIVAKSLADKVVLRASNGSVVDGKVVLIGNRAGFYATRPLMRGARYEITFKKGIQSTEGPNGLENDLTWAFTVADAPSVISSNPGSGAKDISEQHDLEVMFKTPMDEESFEGNVTISPEPDRAPSLYFSAYNNTNRLSIGTYLARSAHYTITVGAGVKDQYGVSLGTPYTFSFDTAPYKPAISIYPNNTYFAAFNQDVIPRIVAQVVNANKVDYTLYRLERADLLDLYRRRYEQACGQVEACRTWQNYDPGKLSKVRSWTETYASDLNTPVQVVTKVNSSNGDKLPPGFYFLDVRIPQGPHDNMVMIVSRSTVTVKKSDNQIFVWGVSQSTGSVEAGMKIQLTDSSGAVIADGTTNSDGVFMKDANLLNKNNLFIFGAKDNDVVVAADSWSSGIDRYDFGLPSYYNSTGSTDWRTKPEYKLFLTEDRPIYRPGQQVFFKGLVRKDNDGAYESVKQGEKVTVTIKDARGRQVYTQELPLSTFGSFSGDFTLSKDANLGLYSTTVKFLTTVFDQQFQVEEYKKPELAMEVKPNKDSYIAGDTATVTLHASYYFGAPVSNAPVTWTVNRQGYAFRWDKDWRYEFGDPDSYWSSLPWWNYQGQSGSSGAKVTEGTSVTDVNGELQLQIPLDISKQTSSQVMVVEASVNDASNQSVGATEQFTVHKASVYAGLRPVSYGNQSGNEAKVDVQTVDTDGHELADIPVSLEFFKRTWETVREKDPDDGQFYYTSKPHDTSVGSSDVKTDSLGHATAAFTPKEGGTYKVMAKVTDKSGNTNTSGTFLWVSGWGFSAPRENNDRITLVSDKRDYVVGENMSLFVASPYASESAKTLLTVERGNVLSYKVVDTADTSNNFELPVDTKYTPNVFLGAVLVRGGNEVKKPAEFKIGYTEVKVSDKTKQITVDVKTDKTRYQPRDTMNVTIETKDLTGASVPSEIAFGVVDKAVWDLSTVEFPDIYKTFYQPRSLGVDTSQLLTISMDRINANTNLGSKGGSGGGCFTGETPILMAGGSYKNISDIKKGDTILTRTSERDPALVPARVTKTFTHIVDSYLIINGSLNVTPVHKMYVNGTWMVAGAIESGDWLLNKNNDPVRVNSVERVYGTFTVYNLSVETYRTFIAGDIYVHNDKGGFDTSRTNFPDTAYWNPSIKTDQNGLARIKIPLPDSLTTWRLGAIANNQKAAFGSGVSEVIVARDVLIRPFMPRFLSYGDKATLGAIVVNTSGNDEDLTTTIAADGLDIAGSTSVTKHVNNGDQVKFVWDTTALHKDKTKISLKITGAGGKTLDKMETSFPIKTYSVPEVVATSGNVKSVAREKILLPKSVDPALGAASVSLSPSLGAGSFNAMNYLFDYPYYCTEQITSRLLPSVYLYRILSESKLDALGPFRKNDLKNVISDAIQRLNNDQHSDGGWGWWIESESDPYLTAYAFMGLSEAAKAKLTVSDSTVSRAKNYLETALAFGIGQDRVSLGTQAFILYALSGQSDKLAPYASNLYERRFELTVESRAYLAISMKNMSGMGDRSNRIMQELTGLAKKTATTTHWEEAKKAYQYMGSNTTTTAAMLEALILYNKNNPLISEVIRYLMTIRTDQHWFSTRDTAAVMKAIATQMLGAGDQKVDEQYRISLNGGTIDSRAFTAKDLLTLKQYTLPITKLTLGTANDLEISKSGTGNLYYNIDLKYYLPFTKIDPLEQGITVMRELVSEDGKLLPPDSMAQNTEAWERLTLVIPEDRHFVVIEDVLPAGLESVNESLKNVAVLNKQAPKVKEKGNQRLYFEHKEYHDDRTTFFADYLPAGVYEMTYRVRATTPGTFHRPPVSAYQMYVPDVSGHSEGGWFEVK